MAALATEAELREFLRTDIEPAPANQALSGASQQIRDSVGWSISAEAGVVATLDGDGTFLLWLPTKLLTVVTSVVEDGVTLTFDVDYVWRSSGLLLRKSLGWRCGSRNIVVTFDHGYASVPASIRDVCLSLAGRMYDNPTGVFTRTVGSVSESRATASGDIGPLLSGPEIRTLASYRRVGV